MIETGAQARADLAACRALLRTGSRSFHLASLVLPASVRAPASALYAFCRVADDAVDEGGGAAALSAMHARLERAYAGRALDTPIDRALAHVLHDHAIPRALPEALLEGFAWDAEGRRYENLPALFTYAARVAGAVGAMMAVLMGARDPARVSRACDLGVAMQLSNIARDVGEDARAGRCYLPLAWLRAAGLDAAAPVAGPALAAVVARLLAEADVLYARAATGVRALPPACRPGIGAARLLYAEIGREVLRRGAPIDERAVVGGRRKLTLVARAVAGALAGGQPDPAPPLAETRFLVEAVLASPLPARPIHRAGWAPGAQAAWVVDLFTRLHRRHAGAGVPAPVAEVRRWV